MPQKPLSAEVRAKIEEMLRAGVGAMRLPGGSRWEPVQSRGFSTSRTPASVFYLSITGESAMSDPVNRPTHYSQNGIECIEAIKASKTPEEFRGYLKGNAMKYMWRYQHKGNPAQDIAKAQWYLTALSTELAALNCEGKG